MLYLPNDVAVYWCIASLTIKLFCSIEVANTKLLREVAVVERYIQKSMYGLLAKKVAVSERWVLLDVRLHFKRNVFRHRMLNSKVDYFLKSLKCTYE